MQSIPVKRVNVNNTLNQGLTGIPLYIYLCGFGKRYLHEFCRTFSFEARLVYYFSSL